MAPISKLARYKYKGKKCSIDGVTTLDLDTASVCMKTTRQSIAVYGRFAPFSNIFPVELKIDKKIYTCVEQFYQSERAVYDDHQDLSQENYANK